MTPRVSYHKAGLAHIGQPQGAPAQYRLWVSININLDQICVQYIEHTHIFQLPPAMY